jgi:hypothetical protein
MDPRLHPAVAVSRQRVRVAQPDPGPQPGRIAHRALAVAPSEGAFPAEIGLLEGETQAAQKYGQDLGLFPRDEVLAAARAGDFEAAGELIGVAPEEIKINPGLNGPRLRRAVLQL